jgi:hypothetical protein
MRHYIQKPNSYDIATEVSVELKTEVTSEQTRKKFRETWIDSASVRRQLTEP